MKTIIYCRVSSLKQQTNGVSLDVQQSIAQQFCDSRGWSVVQTISEVASATCPTKQRSLLQWISQREESTKNNSNQEPIKLVIYNVSRFSRNVSKGLELARKLTLLNVCLCSCIELLDLESPSGEFNFINLLNAAEFESKMIGKRVSDVLAQLKQDGNKLGPPPYGWKALRNENGKRVFEEETFEQKVLSFIKACRTKGTSLKELNQLLSNLMMEETNNNNNSQGCSSKASVFETLELNPPTEFLETTLPYFNIAEILNEYAIPNKKGKCWTASCIYTRFFHSVNHQGNDD